MQKNRPKLRLSVETKILIPFLVFFGLLPAAAVLLVRNPGLRPLIENPRNLAIAAFGGALVSAIVVWALVRRVTRLLRQLRTMADLVGRGDFSRRVDRYANDEGGDLAEAFNRMSADLQNSRLKLEKDSEALQATQAQLIQSEKLSAVGQFVSGVAHELNNPLAVVIGYADFMVETETDEKKHSRLEKIAKSAHRCHKIVANLLGFARQHVAERKPTSVNETLDNVVEFMAYDLRTSNIDAVKDYQAGLPAITADGHRLQQIFVNLIGNARQATEGFRPDGRIIVRTRSKDGFIRVEISDNGPGISPENIKRIFEPFFTTKPAGKGTGLGLSLVMEILHEHGGRISVESEVGRGATFLVELPIASDLSDLQPEAIRRAARPPRPAGSSGKMVLVVDDEEWILDLARDLLGGIGHGVETVRDGEAALAAVERRNFDAIVCDWKMPGMNGAQFFERLLETKPHLAKLVLFMSGEVIDDAFQEFLWNHEKTCLVKPFPIEEFRDAVEKMMLNADAP